MNKDLHNNIAVCMMYEPQDTTADTYSNLVDLSGFESCEILVHVGAVGSVSGSNYFEFTLQESDTTSGTDFTTVAAADMLGAFTKVDSNTEDQTIQRVGYIGGKRYLRVLMNETGTVTACVLGVTAVLGNARHAPESDVTPVAAV